MVTNIVTHGTTPHDQNNQSMVLNFGPQHPAAHGVLRLLVALDGEVITNTDAHIGLLHRGTEKLIESKSYIQSLPYFDRLDYVSMMAQEHLFSLAVERLCGMEVSLQARGVRVIFLELTRILNHLLAITTHALDVGAITPFFWGFEERECLMEFYERVSGARMHSAFIRPGGIAQPIPENLLTDISKFCVHFRTKVDELRDLLSKNRIWTERLVNVGVVPSETAKQQGFSGVMLRGSGIDWDLRQNAPYECYRSLVFDVVLGENGDCYDRYLVRMGEMLESVRIIEEVIFIYFTKPWGRPDPTVIGPAVYSSKLSKKVMHRYMESVIRHFKVKTGFAETNPVTDVHVSTEAPKGETSVYLSLDNSSNIYRCHIKAPGFLHLQGIDWLSRDHMLADLVTIIGTADIVFGEIDR